MNMYAFIQSIKANNPSYDVFKARGKAGRDFPMIEMRDKYHISHNIKAEDFSFLFSQEYKEMNADSFHAKVVSLVAELDARADERRRKNLKNVDDNVRDAEYQDILRRMKEFEKKYGEPALF